MQKQTIQFGYDGSQGAGYQAIECFATFVGLSHATHTYTTHIMTDHNTNTFDYHDPLAYQATTRKDPDLLGYMVALTGPDHEGFYEGMRTEVCELENKQTWIIVLHSDMKCKGRQALSCTWVF